MEIRSYLESYFDYEAYGRDVALEGGEFTDFAMSVIQATASMKNDGQIESILEEYRVMNFEDEEPELRWTIKWIWRQTLPDLDEFSVSTIRRRRHSTEPHEQKELIADLLLMARPQPSVKC